MPAAITANRKKGLERALKEHPQVELLASQPGNYRRLPAVQVFENLMQRFPQIDGVVCANDDMAVGVAEALAAAGRGGKTKVVGIDAIPDGIAAIQGEMQATADYSGHDQGYLATVAAVRHLRGEKLPKEIALPVVIVEKANSQPWAMPVEEKPTPDWNKVIQSRNRRNREHASHRDAGLRKHYGGVQALAGADFTVYPREIHALVGDNAAGKSRPDQGALRRRAGRRGRIQWTKSVSIREPRHAQALGIETVYQDLALADNLDIPANIFLGRELLCKGLLAPFMDLRRMNEEAARLLGRLKIRIPTCARRCAPSPAASASASASRARSTSTRASSSSTSPPRRWAWRKRARCSSWCRKCASRA